METGRALTVGPQRSSGSEAGNHGSVRETKRLIRNSAGPKGILQNWDPEYMLC